MENHFTSLVRGMTTENKTEDEKMVFIKRVIQILLSPFRTIVQKYKYKKRIKELQKRDPFIYK